ncbi:MAG: chitobiase/beta-hexosaminidase C-terminal domain-containing protein [Oscillospiraceae bacterium]|nr:chitobiase/beta-hexosaminidase C-terminal domain-containing protein [Oscillospiraceae bacterium]
MKKALRKFMMYFLAMTMLVGLLPTLAAQAIDDGYIRTTPLSVSPDYEWYTADIDISVFTISTEAELIGFIHILNGTASGISQFYFTDRTILLGNDIYLTNELPEINDEGCFGGYFDARGFEIKRLFLIGKNEDGAIRNNAENLSESYQTAIQPYGTVVHYVSNNQQLREALQDTSNPGRTIRLLDSFYIDRFWQPIDINGDSFTLDGQGHTLTMENRHQIESNSAIVNGGLFGSMTSGNVTIKEFGLSGGFDVETTANNATSQLRVGSFFGIITGGTVIIERSFANGVVRTYRDSVGQNAWLYSGGFIGLIMGSNANVIITDSYYNGWVSSDAEATASGLLGVTSHSTYSHAGGLVGRRETGSLSITNSYAVGNVYAISNAGGALASCEAYAGGLVGRGTVSEDTDNYHYLNNLVAENRNGNGNYNTSIGIPRDESQMKNKDLPGFGFDIVWGYAYNPSIWGSDRPANEGFPILLLFYHVDSVSIDQSPTITIPRGQTQQLTATVLPSNAVNKNVTWRSWDESIATVDRTTGMVTAQTAGGPVVIEATAHNGVSSHIEVVVTVPSTGVLLTNDGVSIEQGEVIRIRPGETGVLRASVLPMDATNRNVTWQVSNRSTVELSLDLNVPVNSAMPNTFTALSPGEAVITVTPLGGGDPFIFTVIVRIPVDGLTIDDIDSTELHLGTDELPSSLTMAVTIDPTDATNQNVLWSADPLGIAIIAPDTPHGRNSEITAINAGPTGRQTVKITATSAYNEAISDYRDITVTQHATGIAIERDGAPVSSISVIRSAINKLTAKVEPENTYDKAVIWRSKNENIVSVDDNGVITTIGFGITDITVTTADGRHTAVVEVEVIPVGIQRVATPRVSPAPNNLLAGAIVALSCETSGAIIHYTTDGSKPTEISPVYLAPFTINISTFIKAKAFLDGMTASDTAEFAFGIIETVSTSTASIASGTVRDGTRVALQNATSGATIRYTLDGSEPNENSHIYSAPIPISTSTTIRAKAFMRNMLPSNTATFTYQVKVSDPIAIPSPNATTILSGTPIRLISATFGDDVVIRYTADGSEPTDDSPVFMDVMPIYEPATIKAKAFKNSWIASDTMAFAYNSIKTTMPIAQPASSAVLSGTQVELSCSTPGMAIRYTTDGSEPNESSDLYSAPIPITSAVTIKAKAFRDGMVTSDTLILNYDVRVFIPLATPGSNAFVASGDNISLFSPSSDATIYYTLDGRDPTVNSLIYSPSSPIQVAGTVGDRFIINAIAIISGLTPSNIATYTYTIAPRVAMPTPSHASGSTIPGGQRITLYCSEPDAVIRFTTNGSEPNDYSQIYTSPITITARRPETTIKVRAYKHGLAPSHTAEFTYKVGAPVESSIDLGKISVPIPDFVPLLGGNNLDIDINNLPASFIYDEDRILGVLGITVWNGKGDSFKSQFDLMKAFTKTKATIGGVSFERDIDDDAIDRYFHDLFNNNDLVSSSPPTFMGGILKNAKVEIIGYVEGILPKDGVQTTMSGHIMLRISTKTRSGDLQAWITVWSFHAEGSLSLTGGLRWVNMNSPVLEASLNGSLAIEARAGLGMAYVAHAGMYGKGTLNAHWNITNNYLYLQLLGSYGSYETVLFWTAKQECDKGTLWQQEYRWDNGWWRPLPQAFSLISALSDTDNYALAARNYLGAQSEWMGIQTPRTRSLDSIKVLQESIYNQTAPIIAEANGKRVMVFLADDGSRDDMNRTILMYSVNNVGTDTWSTPRAVFNDGTADFYPSIASDGESIWVSWHKSKTTFGYDASVHDVLSASEIAVARFDSTNNRFADVEVLTDDSFINTQPKIAVNGENVVVTWVQNTRLGAFTLEDFLGTNGHNNRIMSRMFSNGVWDPEAELASGLGAVIDKDVGILNNDFYVAYITDNDNSMETIHDRNLLIRSLADTSTRSLTNDSLVSMPRFTIINGVDAISWYEEGNLFYMTSEGQINAMLSEPDMPTDSFRIINNNSGESAIIYSTFEDGVGYINARLYQSGSWGNAFRLEETGNFASYFDGVWESNGEFMIVFNSSNIVIVGEDSMAELVESNDLCMMKAALSANIRLIKVLYIDDDVIRGQSLPVVLEVENTGGFPIYSVDISVNGELVDTIQLPNGLKTGETASVEFMLDIPASIFEPTTFSISVNPNGFATTGASENSRDITLGYSNLMLWVDKIDNVDNTVIVIANIENTSNFDANAMLFVRRGSLEGDIIDFVDLRNLSGGETILYEFNYDPNTLVPDGEEYEVLYYELASDKPYAFNRNDFAIIYPVNTVHIVNFVVDSRLSTAQVKLGGRVPQPDIPIKSGCVFAGWRVGNARGIHYDFDLPVTSDFALYASWVSTTAKDFISIVETAKNSRVWVLTFNVIEIYSDGTKMVVKYSINLNGNNANFDGKYTFTDGPLKGYTLVYDIKGNGSNINEFRLI